MNFAIKVLTSIRFAVATIGVIILVSVVGTLYPGGDIVFGSLLFLALIGILAISTALCSLTRIVPLWRDVRRPQVEVSDHFIQTLPYAVHLSGVTLTQVRDSLKGLRDPRNKNWKNNLFVGSEGAGR